MKLNFELVPRSMLRVLSFLAFAIIAFSLSSPTKAQTAPTEAELRTLVEACQAAIIEEIPTVDVIFPRYSERDLDSSIGFLGLGASKRQIEAMLRDAPYVNQIEQNVDTLQKALGYGFWPEMMIEFAVEASYGDRTAFIGYEYHVDGLTVRLVRESYSFEFK